MTWLAGVLVVVLVGGALVAPSRRRARHRGYATAIGTTAAEHDASGDGEPPA